MDGTQARKTDLAQVFRALGDPNRLAIFQLVRSCCSEDSGQSSDDIRNSVTEIANQFDLSLSTVSHHLKELRQAGLIRCERRGQHIFCYADPTILGEIDQFIRSEES